MKAAAKNVLIGAGRVLARADARPRVVVLCYHSVHPDHPVASATPASFDAHLGWLAAQCDVIPLSEVHAPRPDGRPAVAITFDDGYLDNYEHAFPLLRKHGLTATFFLTTGFLNDESGVETKMRANWRSEQPLVPMTWAHAEEMQRGGMEIGAHTRTHPNLATLSMAQARTELTQPKDEIEQRLGVPVRSMAYPFGKYRRHFTDETMQVAEEAGYAQAAAVAFRAVRPGDHPLALPRFFVAGDSVAMLRDKVQGAWDVIGHLQEKLPLPLARRLSPMDFSF